MSYCRWSSDDHQSDVYCYENVSGAWTTHVAGRRYTFTGPLPPPLPDHATAVEHMNRMYEVRCLLGALVPIGLPYDGETFDDGSAAEMLARLLDLRKVGYRVPEDAIESLRRARSRTTMRKVSAVAVTRLRRTWTAANATGAIASSLRRMR